MPACKSWCGCAAPRVARAASGSRNQRTNRLWSTQCGPARRASRRPKPAFTNSDPPLHRVGDIARSAYWRSCGSRRAPRCSSTEYGW